MTIVSHVTCMYIITPPLTCASKYKIHFNCVILELVQTVLRSSFAKLVILLKEIAYAVFDLPGALFFFHIIVILCGGLR